MECIVMHTDALLIVGSQLYEEHMKQIDEFVTRLEAKMV